MSFEEQRRKMVELLRSETKERLDEAILKALGRVERHRFVNEIDVELAYANHAMAIGEGQTISQPLIVALMTQALNMKGGEKVLEIGTGSGYQAAVLAELNTNVYTIERIHTLYTRAEKMFTELGYQNIHQMHGDGSLGWKEKAPFDRIIVTAAAPKEPEVLFQQLCRGGRMVVPVGGRNLQKLHVVIKGDDYSMIVKRGSGCVFVPLIGADGWEDN